QEILDKLRKAGHALPKQPDFDAPVYHTINEPLETAFGNNLEKVNGRVHLFKSDNELYNELKAVLSNYNGTICCSEPEIQSRLKEFQIDFSPCKKLPENIAVGITGCEFLIAHTGSIMVSSAQQGGRQLFVYPPVHFVIAKKSQLVDYLEKAYSGIQEKYKKKLPSQISLITGPSRTADIEKTLILGAHGPKELHVFIA
ncbi:MAG: lactate utilization protein, partial [Prolixibacteraceae bacterium]|nr:lactate utilization protein [Prolixibacteraceae bacterium]